MGAFVRVGRGVKVGAGVQVAGRAMVVTVGVGIWTSVGSAAGLKLLGSKSGLTKMDRNNPARAQMLNNISTVRTSHTMDFLLTFTLVFSAKSFINTSPGKHQGTDKIVLSFRRCGGFGQNRSAAWLTLAWQAQPRQAILRELPAMQAARTHKTKKLSSRYALFHFEFIP